MNVARSAFIVNNWISFKTRKTIYPNLYMARVLSSSNSVVSTLWNDSGSSLYRRFNHVIQNYLFVRRLNGNCPPRGFTKQTKQPGVDLKRLFFIRKYSNWLKYRLSCLQCSCQLDLCCFLFITKYALLMTLGLWVLYVYVWFLNFLPACEMLVSKYPLGAIPVSVKSKDKTGREMKQKKKKKRKIFVFAVQWKNINLFFLPRSSDKFLISE